MAMEKSDNETYVVRCRGLPWSVTKDDIAEFFDKCELANEREKSIILMKNRDGRLSGEAYVILGSEEDLNEALKKDRKNIGSRYVEVFTAKFDEMIRAMNRSVNYDNAVMFRDKFGMEWKSKEDMLPALDADLLSDVDGPDWLRNTK